VSFKPAWSQPSESRCKELSRTRARCSYSERRSRNREQAAEKDGYYNSQDFSVIVVPFYPLLSVFAHYPQPMTVETPLPDLFLRPASSDDCALILRFIRELAEYERLSHEVVATESVIHESLFGDSPYARVLIAEFQGEPVGYALFFHNYSTFTGRPGIYLEDLFVQPKHRGKGYGKCLLAYVARLAVDERCSRVEWSVLDWNEPAIRFYRSIGATPMDGWTVQRLDGAELASLANEFPTPTMPSED